MSISEGPVTAFDVEQKYSRYAFPLIIPFIKALNIGSDKANLKEKCLLDSFESLLKYLVYLLVAVYRFKKMNEPRIEQELSKLNRPSLGMYAGLLRELLKIFKKEQNYFSRELSAFYEEKCDGSVLGQRKVLLDIIGQSKTGKQKSYKDLIDVLISFRNRYSHAPADADTEVMDDHAHRGIKALAFCIDTLLTQVRSIAELSLCQALAVHRTPDGEVYDIQLWNGFMPKKDKRCFPAQLQPGHCFIELRESDKETLLVDLFPYIAVLPSEKYVSGQIYLLDGFTKSKVQYSSYQTGEKRSLTAEDTIFYAVQESLQHLDIPDDIYDLTKEPPKPSEEAIANYNKALVEIDEENTSTAISLLECAIDWSPGFEKAVVKKADLEKKMGNLQAAHETLDGFLSLWPNKVDIALEDAKLLLRMEKSKKAKERIKRILTLDPHNHDALNLMSLETYLPEEDEEMKLDEDKPSDVPLLYEVIAGCFCDSPKYIKRFIFLFVFLATGICAWLFCYYKDFIMTLTIISMGFMWGVVIWTTFRIRNLMEHSRPNFAAFLRTQTGSEPDTVFYDLVIPVFGGYPDNLKGFKRLCEGVKQNWIRLTFVSIGAALTSIMLFYITKYSTFDPIVDVAYSLFVFLFAFSGLLLTTYIYSFHRLLKQLSFQQIHFSLVQHPKLSIRYLSNLSRKVSYPQIFIYILATFTLYLGPFLANIAYVAALSVLLIVICYAYYHTIFLVRKVIIINKWRLISRFSVHFQEPFNRLISKAQKRDMERIEELIKIRDFIDSMDVWAEKKSVLLVISLLYITVLLLSTVGMSNAMTRHVMPRVSRYANKVADVSDKWNIFLKGLKPDIEPEIKVRVKDVDDTVVVCWGKTIEELTNPAYCLAGTTYEINSKNAISQRCDWSNSVHGAMNISLPFEKETHVIFLAYNKVYEAFMYMGGGKLSYDIEISLEEHDLLKEKRFIRFNTRELGYCAYLHLVREDDKVSVKRYVGKKSISLLSDAKTDKSIISYIEFLEEKLSEEPDSAFKVANEE